MWGRLCRALRRGSWLALLAPALAARAAGPGLPREVEQALQQAHVPRQALVAVVQDTGNGRERLAWQAEQPVNPASLTKLLTTYAALDILGPAWAWHTPVWLDGPVRDGVLEGNLAIQGQGDPKLVQERLWLLLRRVRQLGVREIRGDIVLDRSAFVVPEQAPGAFDGEAQRAYNVGADALLVNFQSLTLGFVPDASGGFARVLAEPPLLGVKIDAQVPLAGGPCEDWHAALRAEFGEAERIRFAGRYPLACGERQWVLAYAEPRRYAARAIAGLWAEMGGVLAGQVREGRAPAGPPSFEVASPPLADVVRDINKFSNNVMAQQLFLTLGLVQRGTGTPEAAREVMRGWLESRLGAGAEAVVIDNGSGLSRETRLTAATLARLLQQAWADPLMPELVSSLPVSGLDGTLKRSNAPLGRAHLKTGSLRDVAAVAGYVLGASGRRQVLVAIVNHPNANAARPALEALVRWAAQDLP